MTQSEQMPSGARRRTDLAWRKLVCRKSAKMRNTLCEQIFSASPPSSDAVGTSHLCQQRKSRLVRSPPRRELNAGMSTPMACVVFILIIKLFRLSYRKSPLKKCDRHSCGAQKTPSQVRPAAILSGRFERDFISNHPWNVNQITGAITQPP